MIVISRKGGVYGGMEGGANGGEVYTEYLGVSERRRRDN
jgi:hypothetical protein